MEKVKSILVSIEWITLNIASIGVVIVDVSQAFQEYIPNSVTWFVGISIGILNLARAYKYYKQGKNENKL